MSREAMQMALDALEKCRLGFEFTRQYVGVETLPAKEGWSWYDGDMAAIKAIAALSAALAEQPAALSILAQKPLEEPFRSILADNAEALYIRDGQPAAPVVLTDAEIDDILDEAHRQASASGITNGGMVGDLWNHIAARAILAAAIPPGHCVVPVEPTPAMSEAGQHAHYEAEKKIKAPGAFEQGGFARRSVRASYVFKAMIAARPGEKE